jgi:hypothetical protein
MISNYNILPAALWIPGFRVHICATFCLFNPSCRRLAKVQLVGLIVSVVMWALAGDVQA